MKLGESITTIAGNVTEKAGVVVKKTTEKAGTVAKATTEKAELAKETI